MEKEYNIKEFKWGLAHF